MIESLIFFPEKVFYEKPEDYGFAYEEVALRTEDGVELFGWYLRPVPVGPGPGGTGPGGTGTILFFHGNAGNISHRLYKVKGWTERGFGVLLLDYRGYGKSQGRILRSEDVLKDARAALRWLVDVKNIPLSHIILYGESLGTYPAIHLGAEFLTAVIILEAPFTSLYDVARVHYPFVMKGMMKDLEFSNTEAIAHLKAPVFILHGNQDEICPYAMAGELFEAAPEPKGFLSIPNGRHNDLPMTAGEDFWQKPYEFVMKNAKFIPRTS